MSEQATPRAFDTPTKEAREGEDVWIAWAKHGVGMRFSRHHMHSDGALSATLEIVSLNAVTGEPEGSLLGPVRVNLLGPNHQRDTSKALAQREGHLIDWDAAVRHGFKTAYRIFTTPDPAVNLRLVADEPLSHLVDWVHGDRLVEFLPENELTTLQGDGASVKSYLAQMILVAVATGQRVGPFVPRRKGNVYVADWETRRAVQRRRLRRICQGFGIDPEPDYWYRWCDAPLVAMADHLRRDIDRYEIDLIVLDSVGPAVGADVSAENVLPFQAAVRSLGEHVTKLMISHVSHESAKGSNVARAYGSVFVRNLSRMAYEIKRTGKEDRSRYLIAATREKVNEGPEEDEPMGMRIVFDDPEGGVVCEPVSADEAPSIATRMKLSDRAIRELRSGALSNADLAMALEVTENVIRTTMLRAQRDGHVVQVPNPDGKGRYKNLWALRARDEAPADFASDAEDFGEAVA